MKGLVKPLILDIGLRTFDSTSCTCRGWIVKFCIWCGDRRDDFPITVFNKELNNPRVRRVTD